MLKGVIVEILAGLVRLDEGFSLPAPWFNRPSLGMNTYTIVDIAVLQGIAGVEAPPDIIVTPLRTGNLRCTSAVTIDVGERPGAIYDVLTLVSRDINIALAETVTIDQRGQHRISLILEPPGKSECTRESERDFQNILKDLERKVVGFAGKDSFHCEPV